MSGRGMSPQMSLICTTPAMRGVSVGDACDRHGQRLTGEASYSAV